MPKQANISEEALVKRLRERDKEALAYLYDHYSGALFGTIVRILRSEELAAEVLQDGFLKVWENIGKYDAGKGRLFTWMLNIFRNLAIDKTRSREMRSSEKTDPLDQFVYDLKKNEVDELQTDTIGLEDVVKQLNRDQQFVVQKIYFEGFTHSEVAKEYDIPLGTVKTRLRQALLLLRQKLKAT